MHKYVCRSSGILQTIIVENQYPETVSEQCNNRMAFRECVSEYLVIFALKFQSLVRIWNCANAAIHIQRHTTK